MDGFNLIARLTIVVCAAKAAKSIQWSLKNWLRKHGCNKSDLIMPFIVYMLAELEVFKRAVIGMFPLQLKQCMMTCFLSCRHNKLIYLVNDWFLIDIVTWPNPPVLPSVLAILPPHFIQFGLLLCWLLLNLLTADCDVEHHLLIWPTEVLSQLNFAVNITSATCCTSQLMVLRLSDHPFSLTKEKEVMIKQACQLQSTLTAQTTRAIFWTVFFFFLHCLAHHPGTVSIVWPPTELLFFSLVSPRDPKWDTDILVRPVLGLAFDAPECSA